MKLLANLVSLAIVLCGLLSPGLPASAADANVTGTWAVTIHYPPPDGDFAATYVLKQDGRTITGTYEGLHGPAPITGTIEGRDLTLEITVQALSAITARLSGKVASATKMQGTVTGTHSSGEPIPWSAEREK